MDIPALDLQEVLLASAAGSERSSCRILAVNLQALEGAQELQVALLALWLPH